ncbi:uncharacterized protein LOC122329503 [Puntigrus tetrazona]|uniref:uncharacterized protein LOC122329503 n=1 Tax=Puntigrus tetrazona TaxID=1606681 RepID=UPI001C8970B8|nr:uncharacterized protein LOC122329503 [Puntigrus tetrazona]
MTEKEILQATLRNCNPRLASILRGTVNTFDDLVRTGALVERDIAEERAFWKQRQAEKNLKKMVQDKSCRGKPGGHSMALVTRGNVKLLTLNIILCNQSCEAIVDTGSSYSLIQESLWRKWKNGAESWQSSRGQTFALANGHIQRALGEVTWDCTLQECTNPLRLFVMRDEDLAFPLILGLEFLVINRVKLDFDTSTYSLPGQKEILHPFSCYDQPPSVNVHCALPLRQASSDTITVVKDLVGLADVSQTEKYHLEELLLNWPTVCTDVLGQTSVIKHQIITSDSIPVRRRAYSVPVNKQNFIDEEVRAMLSKGIIRPSTSPWAAPVVLVS